ncbi:MAG: hypothetical protein CMB64_05835 [Euryarchaeota archaeon]|nr:hypothetical protein [Euryarchaeota archaeon]|tara:strand:+ start:662 stop:1423 length:762 start_codon:yes stop_codon:yes gene_type:complete
MGLLDKAAEKKVEPKTKEIETPKIQRKERKKSADVETVPTPKREKPKRQRRERKKKAPSEPKVIPAEFELAGRLNRFAVGLANFVVNWGLIVTSIVMSAFLNANPTWIIIGGLLVAITNIILLPIFMGRNLGQFISRTKYINSKSERPLFLHALMNNLNFPLFLIGLILILMGSGDSDYAFVGAGVFCASILIIDAWLCKRYLFQETKQGLWDIIFNAYLVKHIPSGEETGWLAKLEGLGDFAEQKFKMNNKE